MIYFRDHPVWRALCSDAEVRFIANAVNLLAQIFIHTYVKELAGVAGKGTRGTSKPRPLDIDKKLARSDLEWSMIRPPVLHVVV
jgi:hypothetical protein